MSCLVILGALELCPSLTWSLVADIDVAKSPTNLSDRVGAPIASDNLHL